MSALNVFLDYAGSQPLRSESKVGGGSGSEIMAQRGKTLKLDEIGTYVNLSYL